MSKKLAWISNFFSVLSKKALFRWFIFLIFISGVVFIFGNYDEFNTLSLLFSFVTSMGWFIATGLPFVVGASLVFCSKETQNSISAKMNTEYQVRFSIVFVSYLILMLLGK
ncbi:MAG: hypothetical protein JW779_04185 [Candidatus Thorarchaeota archaeon]|nr:hypothetical protein [Candidatus Thorarchaeota archaeon]